METGCGYGYAQARNWGVSRRTRACGHRAATTRTPCGGGPQQQTPARRPMQLPASHVSRIGSGTRDAARTAALYGRPCYQHPFALRVASRVTAPYTEKKTLPRTTADGRELVPVTGFLHRGPVRDGAEPRLASRPGYGISTVFPFATKSQQLRSSSLGSVGRTVHYRRRRHKLLAVASNVG